MPDEFTKVTKKTWGQNIMATALGVIIGIGMFIVSFIVLWSNEGRTNLGKVAQGAVIINPATANSSAEGKLVSLGGPIQSNTAVGDPKYLKSGPYVVLYRHIEMYAWIEEKETREEKKTGGGSEEKTIYRYKKDWTNSPKNSSEFEIPEGHGNPPLTVKSDTFYTSAAHIGIFKFDHTNAILPAAKPIALTTENAIPYWDAKLIGNDYIFQGKGTYIQPLVGDIRINFTAVHTGINVTLFGKLVSGSIAPYYHKGKTRLFRAIEGTHDEAIVLLKTEHKIMGWILRIVGFLLMWIGLNLILGPLNAVLDVLPFLGRITRGLLAIINFFIALILSIITILVSMIFHNLIALIILIIIAGVLIVVLIGRKKK